MRIPRRTPPAVPMHGMSGRVCVVTGASAGIGFETARGLAERGATVCIIGRNPERTAEAERRVRAAARGGEVSSMLADFESLDDVRALAARLLERFPAIHVLVNNAGLWITHTCLASCGIEVTILVNHVAPFLLTNLLLDRLRASAPARVVNVSSRLHIKEKTLRFDDFRAEHRYGGLAAYRQSKLANVLFSNELARRLEGSGVTSNAVHPGDVATSVVRDSKLLTLALESVGRLYLLTPEEGARTSLRVATAPELERVTGRYFANGRETPASKPAGDPAVARRLWDETERIVG